MTKDMKTISGYNEDAYNNNKLSSINCFYSQQRARINYIVDQKLFPYLKCTKSFGKRNADYLWNNSSDRLMWLKRCKIVIENEFSYIIQKYKAEDLELDINKENDSPNVWCCWFQGEKNIPEVVRTCIESQKSNLPIGVRYNFLSLENIDNYIELPGFIIDNVKRGYLTFTHLSDIIRFKLLSEYGGVWMDSTVFVSDNIPESYFHLPIYSIQAKDACQLDNNIFYWPLCSFLIGGAANNLLFRFCYELMLEYQDKYNWLIDGHLINICYAIAFSNFTKTRESIEQIGANNGNRQRFDDIANTVYEKKTYVDLLDSQIFHKLNWRKKYKTYVDGKETFYGHIVLMNKGEI